MSRVIKTISRLFEGTFAIQSLLLDLNLLARWEEKDTNLVTNFFQDVMDAKRKVEPFKGILKSPLF